MFNNLDITESFLVHKLTSDEFHNLCRDFLVAKYKHKEGKGINDFGKAIAKNKPKKGKPDVYFVTNENKYIFGEFTTQAESNFNKLKEDLEGCLKIKENGTPLVKVILIYIGQTLNSDEDFTLRQIASQNAILLEIISKDQLKYELCTDFQDLRLKYLGIPKDSHFIFSIDAFKEKENENKFSTPISENFFGKNQELLGFSNVFQNNQAIIISGPAGIGKTHFSLELLDFIREDFIEYEILVISSFGSELDLKELEKNLSYKTNVILLIDDANRYLNLDYILNFLKVNVKNFRIICTVRDTNLNQILSTFKKCKHKLDFITEELLNPTYQELANILNQKGITDLHCVNHIIHISNQNPRLALMIGNEILKKNDCNLIGDIFNIYQSFYESNLGQFTDTHKQMLGIISFFKGIKWSDKEYSIFIENELNLSQKDLFMELEKIDSTHKILEIHQKKEGQFYKLVDQNINTYCFIKYLLLGNNNIFIELLFRFGIPLHHQINDTLGTLKSYFGSEIIKEKLNKIIKATIGLFIDNEYEKAQFISYYCEFIPEESYLFIARNFESIDNYNNKDIPLWVSKNTKYWQEYNIFLRIVNSCGSNPKTLRDLIEFVVEYYIQNISQRDGIIELLKTAFIYHQEDFFDNYSVQIDILNFLLEGIKSDIHSHQLHKEILELIAGIYLKVYASPCKNRINNLNNHQASYIGENIELLEVRYSVWEFLINGLINDFLNYFNAFQDAIKFQFPKLQSNLVVLESGKVINLMYRKFNPNNFSQNFVFHSYLAFVNKSKEKIVLNNEILEYFKTPIFYNFQMLSKGHFDIEKKRENRDLNKKRLIQKTHHFTILDFKLLYAHLTEIISADVNIPAVNETWHEILYSKLEKEPELFASLLELSITNGNVSNLESGFLLPKWLEQSNNEIHIYNLLSSSSYHLKGDWLWCYFMICKNVDIQTYSRFLKHLKDESLKTIQKVQGIVRYESLKKGAFVVIFTMVAKKGDCYIEDSTFSFSENFSRSKLLLFNIYFQSLNRNYDYQLNNFKTIYSVFPEILNCLLKKYYRNGEENIFEKNISSSKDLKFLRNNFDTLKMTILHFCKYDFSFLKTRKLLEKVLKSNSKEEEEYLISVFNIILKERSISRVSLEKVFKLIIEYIPSTYIKVFSALFENEISLEEFSKIQIHKTAYFYNPKFLNHLAKNEQSFLDNLINTIPKGFQYSKFRLVLLDKKANPRFKRMEED